jgi:hypothetical protein
MMKFVPSAKGDYETLLSLARGRDKTVSNVSENWLSVQIV